MKSLTQLYEERGAKVAAAQAILDELKGDGVTEARKAELHDTFDTAMAEVDEMDKGIEREKRMAAAVQSQTQALSTAPNRPDMDARSGDASADEMEYGDAFREYLANAGQLGMMSAEARSVLQSGWETVAGKTRNLEGRAQTTANAAGGYMIPQLVLNELVMVMAAHGPMWDGDFIQEWLTDSGAPVTIPTVDDTANESNANAEAAALPDDGSEDVTFGNRALGAFSFSSGWVEISLELSQDSAMAVDQIIATVLGERMGRGANRRLTVGTGSGEPEGIVTGATVGDTAAATNALTADELVDFQHTVDPAYRGNPGVAWQMHDDILKAVRKLKDADGRFLWTMGDIRVNAPDMLLGKPYRINQAMATFAANADVMLYGDMKKYYVRKVGQVLVAAMQDKDWHPGFGMSAYSRFDGVLTDTTAVKKLRMAAS